jgi:hypothetical protein
MLEACKITLLKTRKFVPSIASLAVFLLVVGLARGANWKAALGKLMPLVVLIIVYVVYQTIKERRILVGKERLSKRQLFFRFYLAAVVLFAAYFGIAIYWEWRGGGTEAFGLLFPVFLFCVALCGFALYRELGDFDDDFEKNS